MKMQFFTEARCYGIHNAIHVPNCTLNKQQNVEDSIVLVAEYTCQNRHNSFHYFLYRWLTQILGELESTFFRKIWTSAIRYKTKLQTFPKFALIICTRHRLAVSIWLQLVDATLLTVMLCSSITCFATQTYHGTKSSVQMASITIA